jgi:hypothetical protein
MKNILSALGFIALAFSSYSQQTSNDTIQWSESRKLDWKDFSGKAAAKSGALGHATLLMNAKYHKGLKATTSVDAVFDRKSSFAADNEKNPAMLKYYQTLFNLYEAESRKLRKEFKETRFGLDPDKVFQEKYNAALTALDERVDNYIEETETGSNVAELTKWSNAVQAELKDLETFRK